MPGTNLTRTEAAERRKAVSTHAYRVALDLAGDSGRTFTSLTEIDFSATPGASTFLDIVARSVDAVELNGKPLDPALYADSRFPIANLEAENTVRVFATMEYSRTGEGLHRYVDPADGETYLYSQFEVADARRVFATFEQPDLKARFSFTVDAPAAWRVFSNAPVASKQDAGANVTRWRFQETAPLPCYVTAIVAGPFEGSDDNSLLSIDGRRIRLGVWARKSLAEHLDVDEIVKITRQGFGFYEKNYGHPYPFRKYDQVFVPEFNAGAMENAGLVTIVERYVFKDRPDGYVIDRRAITILHELAHMWFGDLVTMRWWDDLWLNESFAEFMSHLAAFEATEWKNAWSTFFASEKVAAIAQDELSSTHPVAADIRDLEDVLVNFDTITYGKGASALKQLVAWVGQERFLAGVRTYIAKHKWANATLDDLMAEVEAASGRDLSDWTRVWLQEAGVNTLTPEVTMDGERIARLDIVQTCDKHASLRPHRVWVTGYNFNPSGRILRALAEEIDIVGERTEVPGFAGKARPALILVNYGDHAYAKIGFDEVSLATIRTKMTSIDDCLARTQAVFSLWTMCRDGDFPPSEYVRIAMSVLETETDGSVIRMIIRTLNVALKLYCAPESRDALRAEVADAAFGLAASAAAGSDRQLQAAGLAISLSVTVAQLDRIAGWLDGQDTPDGYAVDSSQRWLIVQALAAAGRIGMADIDAEYSRDETSYGQARAAHSEGALPDRETRERVWQEILDGSTSNARHRALCLGMASASAQSVAPYAQRYFEAAESVWARHSVEIASNALETAFPLQLAGRADLGVDVIALGDGWLAGHRDAAPACYRLVCESVDRARRVVRAQTADRDL